MKTSTVGIVSAAILTVAAAVGFGIAQAGGDPSDNPTWTLQDQEAVEQYQDYSVGPYTLALPSANDFDYGADGSPSSDVAQSRGAVETGSVPEMGSGSSVESRSLASLGPTVEIGGVTYHYNIDTP